MPKPPAKILVALSGGPDSVALLRLMHRLGFELEAAHCNFGLRPEADSDAEFCHLLCNDLGIVFHHIAFQTKKICAERKQGVQLTARQLRYEWFESLLASRNIKFCATAHHADDQAETLLASLIKGASSKVLLGIPEISGPYIRPLLGIKKAELLDWLKNEGAFWKTDLSNDSNDYQRNRIRNLIIPAIEGVNPNFVERLQKKFECHQAQLDFLNDAFRAIEKDVIIESASRIVLDRQAFSQYFPSTHFGVFLEWYMNLNGFQGHEIEAALMLPHSLTGSTVSTRTHQIHRDREKWLFLPDLERSNPSIEVQLTSADIESACTIYIGAWELRFEIVERPKNFEQSDELKCYWLDIEKLNFPITIRQWQFGDRIQPRGMKGTKLVSDILIDEKLSQLEKSQALVIEAEIGLCLLIPHREAQNVAISTNTNRCLAINARRLSN